MRLLALVAVLPSLADKEILLDRVALLLSPVVKVEMTLLALLSLLLEALLAEAIVREVIHLLLAAWVQALRLAVRLL